MKGVAAVERTLQRRELRVLAILGVPTFALALAITTVSTYLPVLAERFSDSSIVIGLLIGGEGLMALWLPLAVGTWSDRLETPIGSRLPFILAATFPLVLALAVLGFVRSIWLAAIVMAVFFAAYFVAYEPYRALYPDLMDDEIAGRAQSSQAIFRGLGTFLALLGGGLLFSISAPLPFVAAAIIVGASLTSFTLVGIRRRRRAEPRRDEHVGDVAKRVVDIVRGDRPLQAFLVANALWELALAALKTFVVLWATKTLGFSLAGSSGAIAAGAAIVLVGRAGQRTARRQARPRARHALLARALRRRPARPVPHHGDAAAAALRAAGGVRRRRHDVAALRAADADDAPRPARRGDRPVLAQPRAGHVARPAAGRHRRAGSRARTTSGCGLSARWRSCCRSRPCGPCTTTDWLVSQ